MARPVEMCGIAGLVEWIPGPPDASARGVSRMVDALRHRGPDGSGLTSCGGAADRGPQATLGHTRLAIIDLSERGAQPMASPRRPLWLTFNGEVYNYADLRRELEGYGRAFESDSDTEVVLQGFEQWGSGVVTRLRGMFAFAIWDHDRRQLTLARDPFGIKPLYLHRNGRRLVFASEVRALLASGLVAPSLDIEALDLFLRYQTVPTPATLVSGVTMLPPGSVLTVDADDRAAPESYWDVLGSASRQAATDSADVQRETVRTLLQESAALHLVADVPVGLFLSGGIDSSALVSLVASLGQPPRTFAVTFSGTPLDESAHARAVAKAFGAIHQEIPLDESSIVSQLPDALGAVDHPSGDGINTYVVSRAVREAGVKVALSGLGGDELFGGYPSFARLGRLPAYADLWRWTPDVVRRAAGAAVRSIGRQSVSAVKTAEVLASDGSLPEAFPVLRSLFSDAQRARLLGRPARSGADRDPYVSLLTEAQRTNDLDLMALISCAEARTYMHDVLLRDTDQMSMRHGLEVRVPLLDTRLAEYVVGLPAAVKLAAGRTKPLLVDALPRPLPDSAVNRPKQGFVLPFERWMRGTLRPFCEHHLGEDGLGGRGVLDAAATSDLWTQFLDGSPRTTWTRPWTLVALNAWMEETGVSA